ncbi:MAG: hypothetical protein RLZZ283_724 [Candidatus Parcubacteria bacterium]|jgi:hypothetical protein
MDLLVERLREHSPFRRSAKSIETRIKDLNRLSNKLRQDRISNATRLALIPEARGLEHLALTAAEGQLKSWMEDIEKTTTYLERIKHKRG